MQISLSKNSEVPLWQQLAEQIVFLITTGELQTGQRLPSVRALARTVKVHHNTVSEAYQDLVRREWLTRQPGSRLVIGARTEPRPVSPANIDEFINETIQRAKQMGYSLQALIERVRDRLLAQPPDHVLIVEDEAGLREILCREVEKKVTCPVASCSPKEFAGAPGLAVGAQVFAPNHIIEALKPLVPLNHPSVPITYSGADEHVGLVRSLKKASVIATVSVSESLLKTARSLFAPAIGRRHTYKAILVAPSERADLRGIDLAFCDSLAMPAVGCERKIHYQLIAPSSLEHLATAVSPTSIERTKIR
jgi:DNA-binding transcriptional regulator YhcF (GntR family)